MTLTPTNIIRVKKTSKLIFSTLNGGNIYPFKWAVIPNHKPSVHESTNRPKKASLPITTG